MTYRTKRCRSDYGRREALNKEFERCCTFLAEMMEAIERWAEDEFRSTNGQLQWIIADALRRSGRLKKSKKGSDTTPEQDTE